MNNNDFNSLLESVKQAGKIKRGKLKPSRTFTVESLDVKTIRKKLRVTQKEFAEMIGVSPRTLENWEQGRRRPTGTAKALLKIALINPKAVLEALHVS